MTQELAPPPGQGGYNIAASVQPSPGGHHIVLHLGYHGVNASYDLGGPDNLEKALPTIIRGLKDAVAAARRADTGLVLPGEVNGHVRPGG